MTAIETRLCTEDIKPGDARLLGSTEGGAVNSARSLPDSLPLGEEAAALLFSAARTARTFTDEAVTDSQARTIYELTKFGPTALNSQPLRITFVRQGKARDRLIQHLHDKNRQRTLQAPLVAILAWDRNWHLNLPIVFPHNTQLRQQFEKDLESRQWIGTNNAHLQAGYFIIAVRSVGLAAGPMTGFDQTGLDADFFPDDDQRSFMVINIGRPAKDAWHDARLPRLSYEETVTAL